MQRFTRVALSTVLQVFAIIWTILALFPLIWMYYSSMKSLPELTVNKWMPTFHPRWDNFIEAWTGVVKSDEPRAFQFLSAGIS